MRTARELIVACTIALLSGALIFGALTVGLDAWARRNAESGATDGSPRRLPGEVFNAPAQVRTTESSGPAGPVSMVFRGTALRSGLFGTEPSPWIAVSATTAEYRALSAPHLPQQAGEQVAVCPSGDWLAWAYDGGIALYDALSDETTEITAGVEGRAYELRWTSQCDRVAAVVDTAVLLFDPETGKSHDLSLRLTQDQAATLEWTPDGAGLTYVDGKDLVIFPVAQGDAQRVALGVAGLVDLAWDGTGTRLAAYRPHRFGDRVIVFDMSSDPVRHKVVSPPRMGMERLVGWADDGYVAVIASLMQTGPIDYVHQVDVSDASYSDLARLPSPGENWRSPASLAIATDVLRNEPVEVDKPYWPWDMRSKLVATLVVVFFPLGYYMVTIPRRIRRHR